MRTLVSLVLFCSLFVVETPREVNAEVKVICVNARGTITPRTKCKRGETRFKRNTYQLQNVFTVAPTGAQFTSIATALEAAATEASASAPQIVRVAPGTYTVASTLSVGSYVSLEGSGKDATIIQTGAGTGILLDANSVVRGLQLSSSSSDTSTLISVSGGTVDISHVRLNYTGSAASFSGVTIVSNGVAIDDIDVNIAPPSTSFSTGIGVSGGIATIRNARVVVSEGLSFGVLANGGANLTLTDSTVTCSATSAVVSAVRIDGTSTVVLLRNVTANSAAAANNGNAIYSSDATNVKVEVSRLVDTSSSSPGIITVDAAGLLSITNSTIETGTSKPTLGSFDTATIRVAGTKLAGGAVDNSGTAITCAGVWDENFTFSASSCP